ncbi:MAG: hypothetical protein K6B65_03045 [Bacilli bacterium]|nr:hypothetical protein [Bacilli bacterium]
MIRLTILTPNGTAFDGEVDYFIVPSAKGPMQINGGYTPVFELLNEAGVLKIVTGGKARFYAIFHSSLRVEPMKAVLCSQLVDDGYDIDKARANDSLKRAKQRLEERKEGLDIARAKASMERALIRLEVKSLSEGRSSL